MHNFIVISVTFHQKVNEAGFEHFSELNNQYKISVGLLLANKIFNLLYKLNCTSNAPVTGSNDLIFPP